MRVQKPKHTLYIFLAVILCMVICLVILKTGNTPEPVTMNVSLYKVVPDYDSSHTSQPETAINPL